MKDLYFAYTKTARVVAILVFVAVGALTEKAVSEDPATDSAVEAASYWDGNVVSLRGINDFDVIYRQTTIIIGVDGGIGDETQTVRWQRDAETGKNLFASSRSIKFAKPGSPKIDSQKLIVSLHDGVNTLIRDHPHNAYGLAIADTSTFISDTDGPYFCLIGIVPFGANSMSSEAKDRLIKVCTNPRPNTTVLNTGDTTNLTLRTVYDSGGVGVLRSRFNVYTLSLISSSFESESKDGEPDFSGTTFREAYDWGEVDGINVPRRITGSRRSSLQLPSDDDRVHINEDYDIEFKWLRVNGEPKQTEFDRGVLIDLSTAIDFLAFEEFRDSSEEL